MLSSNSRKPYPADVSDEEWAFVAPYLTLITPAALQRLCSLREVLLPRRRVMERSFGWASRFRRLVRDYERLPETVAGLHFLAFACLLLQCLVAALTPS